jgi:O-antigen/teichoic acid export membrane protein
MQTQKNIFYNVLLAISQVLFPLITFPYLARVLGPDNIGLYNFSESYARYFALVAALGISVYGVREIAKKQDQPKALSNTFTELFLINLIATCVLSVVYICTIIYSNKLSSNATIFYWSFVFFFFQVFVLEWFFTGINQFKFIAVRFFIIRLVFVAAIFIFIKETNDYVKYMQLQVGLTFFLGVINFVYLFKFIDIKTTKLKDLNLIKHLKPLFLLFLTIFSISVYLHFDTVLLGILADNESVGYYSAPLKLVKIIIAVLAAITAAMFPKMVQHFEQGDLLQFKKMLNQSFELIMSIGIPTAILVYLLAPEIIFILFGSSFELAIIPLQITAPLILIVSLSTIFGFQILSVHSKDSAILKSAVAGMLFSLTASFLLIPRFKQEGAAYIILCTELLVLSLFIYFSSKVVQLQNTKQVVIREIIFAIPYFILPYLISTLVTGTIIKLLIVLSCSLSWFIAIHFFFVKTSVFRTLVTDIFISRIKK